MTKTCASCLVAYPATNEFFFRARDRTCGLIARCKLCRNRKILDWRRRNKERVSVAAKEWKRRNPESVRATYRRYYPKSQRAILLRRYGITLNDYERILAEQGGVCAICGRVPNGESLSVEHDHQTKQVRGLTHKLCNVVIGWVERNPQGIENIVRYLSRRPIPGPATRV